MNQNKNSLGDCPIFSRNENVNTGINCFESVHGQKLIFWFKNVEFDKLNFLSNSNA